MLIHVNSLGITCIEPDEGHLIRKKANGQTFKKVFLGKQDRVDNYEQIVDVNYVYEERQVEKPLDNKLENAKQDLIKLSKDKLAEHLEKHPLFSTIKHKDGRCYSVTLEKQNLLLSNIVTGQMAKQAGFEYSPVWNDAGGLNEPWTVEELLQLSLEIKEYVNPIVELQQAIEMKIKDCNTIEELKEINIDFNLK